MASILAVEDETELLDLLKEELEAEGHKVVTACNGNDALEKLASFTPEIVISDISMPRMDGFGLLESFRASYPALDDTPFLFLTALANREDELRAREVGVDDYLTKPIDFDMLHSVLATRLRQVARMRERKERQMVKLYTALSPQTLTPQRPAAAKPETAPDDTSEPPHASQMSVHSDPLAAFDDGSHAPEQEAGLAPGYEIDDEEIDQLDGCRVFGSLFRFPNLKSLERNSAAKKGNLAARTRARAKELLKRMVHDETFVSSTADGDLIASYRGLDEGQARATSRQLNCDLQEQLLDDQQGALKQELNLTDETIRDALIVSESLFEVSLSREKMESQESFEKSLLEVIEKTRNNPRAPNLLVSSIRRDEGNLAWLKLIASNDEPLPICFFNYDESSKQKMRASFAFFSGANREKASYLIDALTLDLMENAARQIGPKDIAVVDAHFETLASVIYAATYIRKFLHYAENTTQPFMLNVRSMPQGTTAKQLEDILRPLGKYGMRRAIQIGPAEIGEFAESQMPVSCIVFSYPELAACPHARSAIASHKAALASAGKLLVLRGIEDASVIESLKPLGFDGYAVDLNNGN